MKLRFYTSTFLQHLTFGFLIPTLAIWQVQNGLSFGSVGIITSIGMLTMFLSEVPSSYIADKWSKRGVIGIGYACLLGSFGVLVVATDFILFLVSQILFSLALSILSGTEESLLADIVSRKELSKSISQNSMADESGTLIGMFVAGLFLGFGIDMHQLYLAGLVVILIAFVNLFTLKLRGAKIEGGEVEGNEGGKMNKSILLGLVLIAAVISLRGEVIYQAQFLSFGLTLSLISYIYLFTKTGSIFGSWAGVKVRNVMGNTLIINMCLLAHVICFGVLLLGNILLTILSLFFFFFFENLYRNTMNVFLIESSVSEDRTLNLSLVNAGNSVVLMMVAPVIGYMLDWSFRYAVLILIGIKIIGLASIVFRKWKAA